MGRYRQTWRTMREQVLHTIGFKPKSHNPINKAKRAMQKLELTKTERKAVFGFIKKAKFRVNQREQYHAKGYFFMDEYNAQLIRDTKKVLGEKRAHQFFDMCNDPYF